MAPRKETIKGNCLSCGMETTKSVMPSHVVTCATRDAAIAAANADATTPAERLLYLHVDDMDEPEMWFDIEMRSGATLSDLNQFLLAIWLDCGCYHLSHFSLSEQSFGPGMNMNDSIASVFQKPNVKLFHSYDGQSSECVVTYKGAREGKPITKNPIVLLARNTPIIIQCNMCDAPSTQICTSVTITFAVQIIPVSRSTTT